MSILRSPTNWLSMMIAIQLGWVFTVGAAYAQGVAERAVQETGETLRSIGVEAPYIVALIVLTFGIIIACFWFLLYNQKSLLRTMKEVSDASNRTVKDVAEASNRVIQRNTDANLKHATALATLQQAVEQVHVAPAVVVPSPAPAKKRAPRKPKAPPPES